MDKIVSKKYTIISIALIVVIVAIIIFVIIPKYSPVTPNKLLEKIDFSTSAWIEQYVDKNVGIFGIDFFQNTAFSYTPDFNKMVITYASQKSVAEARDYYLTLPGAVESGKNDETNLNINAEIDGQTLQAYNYYSSVARVFELKLALTETNAEKVISQLEKAFPVEELTKISEIRDIVSGELYGGYVRYQYDNFDEFNYAKIPIFSRAYFYGGTKDNFNQTIKALNEAYPLNKYDDTQDTYYYQINGHIVTLNNFVTDANENIVSVGIQNMESK